MKVGTGCSEQGNWWFPALSDFGFPVTDTWDDFLAWYVSALTNQSSGLTNDPIPSAYLTPNVNRWVSGYAAGIPGPANAGSPFFTPPVLDALCQAVGLRFVHDDYGLFRATSYATAAAADAARWETWSKQCLSGGQLTAQDASWSVPAAVYVFFLSAQYPQLAPVSYPISLATPDLGPPLSLSQYGDNVGIVDGTRGGLIVADSRSDLTTTVQQQAYALQAATDYYLWALSVTDATFRGLVPVQPTGLDYAVEWCHLPDGIFTRVIRQPFSDRNIYGGPAITNSLTVNVATLNCVTSSSGVVTQVKTQYTPITLPPGATLGTPVCSDDEANCCPGQTWYCDPSTGGCVEVFDGSGQYDSLGACLFDCSQGKTSWMCQNGACVEIGGSTGYATQEECDAACTSPPPPPPPPPGIVATLVSQACPALDGIYPLAFLDDVSGVTYYEGSGPGGTTIIASVPDSQTGFVEVVIACGVGLGTHAWTTMAIPTSWSPLAWSATNEYITSQCPIAGCEGEVLLTVTLSP